MMGSVSRRLTLHGSKFAVCKLASNAELPDWGARSSWFSITRTEDELSIIFNDASVPSGVICERDFRLLKLEGPLPFTAIGVLADITHVLADAKIPVLAISTYETDYLLVREVQLQSAITALVSHGYAIDGA